VHDDPIKPTLKAPGTTRSKLTYENLLSSSAFNFNLRCYMKATPLHMAVAASPAEGEGEGEVGRCRLNR